MDTPTALTDGPRPVPVGGDVPRDGRLPAEAQHGLDRVVAGAVRLLDGEAAVLLLVGDGGLEVAGAAGPPELRERLPGRGWTVADVEQVLDRAAPLRSVRLPMPGAAGAAEPSPVPAALLAPLRGAAGELLGLLCVGCPVDADGRAAELVELLATQACLALDNARLRDRLVRQERAGRQLFENAPIGMAVSGVDRVIVAVNQAYCTFVGRSRESLIGTPAGTLTHQDDAAESDRTSDEVRSRVGTVGKIDKRYVRGDGSIVWGRLSLARVPDDGGGADVVVAQVQDITAEREARAALEHQARTDVLTGLGNRETVLSGLAAAVAGGGSVAVLFCDVDDFKTVNDTLGHAAGDRLLVLIAQDLRGVLRPGDCAGRIGGDEFLVVLHDVRDVADAESVAQRIRAASSRTVDGPAGPFTTSITVGLALSEPGQSAEDLLDRADRALYAAKRAPAAAAPDDVVVRSGATAGATRRPGP